MSDDPIALGEKCRDIVTGYEGTCTGRAEYLGNLPKLLLETTKPNDGSPTEQWFAESRVVRR